MTQEIIGLSSRMIVLDSWPYFFRLMLEEVLLDRVLSDCYGFLLAESFRRAPHSSPYTCCCYQKNKCVKFGKLQKAMLFQKSASISKEGNSVSCRCTVAQALSLMSPPWPRLDSVSGCVSFVVNKSDTGKGFCPSICYLLSFYQWFILIFTTVLRLSQNKRAKPGEFKEVMLFRTSGTIGQESNFAYSLLTL
jgi:hypothetical protein